MSVTRAGVVMYLDEADVRLLVMLLLLTLDCSVYVVTCASQSRPSLQTTHWTVTSQHFPLRFWVTRPLPDKLAQLDNRWLKETSPHPYKDEEISAKSQTYFLYWKLKAATTFSKLWSQYASEIEHGKSLAQQKYYVCQIICRLHVLRNNVSK